ncbi:FxLD family lanthipeptide [Streptomyces sp. NPDC059037]|uniref:FxLD family lanthipeptide n=1 Tax=Streptomyces sp. NPDC059037 TaxID=3346710 RepID=UPI0036827AE2
MSPNGMDIRTQEVSAAPRQDPFDLDISVIESGGATGAVSASDGGCAASCGNACASNVA